MHGAIRAGNTSFHFQANAATSAREATSYMTLYVQTLDELFDDIEAAGVTIVAPPAVMPWGMRAFMIRDCNDALVMFADPSTGE